MAMKKINNDDYITSLFYHVSKKKIPVSVHYKNGRFDDTLIFKKGAFKFKSGHDELSVRKNLKINFAFQEAAFEFKSHSLNLDEIEKPKDIYASFRRMLPRIVFDNAYITLNGGTKCKILNISTRGAAFLTETKITVPDIRNLKMSIDEEELYCDGIVRHYNEKTHICGIEFTHMEWPYFLILFNFISQKMYPDIRDITEFSEAEIYKLYHDSGYLGLKAKEEMEINFRNMMQIINIIKGKPQLSYDSTYVKNGEPLATASFLRIYDRTFLGQHLAAVPKAKILFHSKIDVYLSLVDYFLNNPYGDYYLAYFYADEEWHHEMYQKIRGYINNESKFSMDYLQYYEQEVNPALMMTATEPGNIAVLDDLQEFTAFCRKNLPDLEINAYAYNKRAGFSEVKQLYELLGLFAVRRIWRISDGQRNAYAVAEVYSDGLNLFNLLDTCRVYFPRDQEFGPDFWGELLPQVARFYASFQKTKFNLMFKGNIGKQLALPGLRYLPLLGRVIVNREGVAEYKKFVMTNY
jgi:PilZ domain.